jgi:DnaJ-class molecular chaperone
MDEAAKHYQVLGLKENCSEAELEQAYQERVEAWNPANFEGNEPLRLKAQEKLAHIEAAHQFLKARFTKVAMQREIGAPATGVAADGTVQEPARKSNLRLQVLIVILLLLGGVLILVWATGW